MINYANSPYRNQYFIKTSELKTNNTPLTYDDYMNIGYMSGRFGINLNNPNESNNIYKDEKGTYVNINACCSELFESKLNQAGIKFNKFA